MGKNEEAPRALAQNIYRLISESEHPMSRNALAAKAGIDDTTLYRKLDKKPLTFTLEDLLLISDALGVDVTELFAEAS